MVKSNSLQIWKNWGPFLHLIVRWVPTWFRSQNDLLGQLWLRKTSNNCGIMIQALWDVSLKKWLRGCTYICHTSSSGVLNLNKQPHGPLKSYLDLLYNRITLVFSILVSLHDGSKSLVLPATYVSRHRQKSYGFSSAEA